MYNNQNWGAHPDAAGPQGEVSVLWERDLGRQVNATATLADGTLYVGEGAPNGNEGQLYALDPLTGETGWTIEFGAPVTGGAAVDEDGAVYVAAGSDRVAYRSDGSERWRVQINPSPNYAPMTVANDLAYFAADSGRIACIEAGTSVRQWEYFVSAAVESAPVVRDERVYVGSRDGTVTALAAGGGNEEWVVDFDEPVNGLSMRDGRLYAALESQFMVQLDTTGRTRWRGGLDSGVATTPAVAGDLVYVGLRGDAFVALDRSGGLEQWRFDDVNDPFTASPVVVDGTIYVGNQDGSVYALDAESGELEWSFDTGSEIVDPAPVVAGRTVYIGNRSGTFYALSG
jgi:outer membrane protein assembly factor BamB